MIPHTVISLTRWFVLSDLFDYEMCFVGPAWGRALESNSSIVSELYMVIVVIVDIIIIHIIIETQFSCLISPFV